MVNRVHVRYSGSCEDNKEALKAAFISSVQTLLQSEEVCTTEADCSVTDVEVLCGQRSRRDVSSNATDDSDITIRFGVQAILRNKTTAEVTAEDQARIIFVLDDILNSIGDKIDGGYSLKVGGTEAEIVQIVPSVWSRIESNCTVGEVLITGENDAMCCKYTTWLLLDSEVFVFRLFHIWGWRIEFSSSPFHRFRVRLDVLDHSERATSV